MDPPAAGKAAKSGHWGLGVFRCARKGGVWRVWRPLKAAKGAGIHSQSVGNSKVESSGTRNTGNPFSDVTSGPIPRRRIGENHERKAALAAELCGNDRQRSADLVDPVAEP